MFANLTRTLDLHGQALMLRAERQRVIASNIANADTPGYVARDINFRQALSDAAQLGGSELPSGLPRPALASAGLAGLAGGATSPAHIALQGLGDAQISSGAMAYAVQTQPALDNNSVDMDRERANFVDNAVRYESTLRFISGQAKTILSAIQGQ